MSKRSRMRAARSAVVAPLPTLTPSGATVGEVMKEPRRRTSRRDEAFSTDIANVNSALNEANDGRTARLINMLKDSRTRDSRLGAVCRTRVQALERGGKDWVLTPGDESREAKMVCDRVRTIIKETPGLGKLFGHLGHGVLEGFAVCEHDWRKNKRGEVVSVPVFRHPNRFAWDTVTEQLCWHEQGAADSRAATFPGLPLSAFPGKFIVHAPVAGESNYPWKRGVQRSRAIPSMLRRSAKRWGMKALERWGQPNVFVNGVDGDTLELNDEIMSALRAIGSGWFSRLPQGIEPKTIPATLSELHLRWIEAENTEDAIAILGQNLTTEVTAGSFAATKEHRNVRLDILAGDFSELAESVIDQWIRLLVEYNWPGVALPVFDFVLSAKGEITVAHYQAGLFSADEVRARLGEDPKPDGSGGAYYVAPPTQALFAAPTPSGGAVAAPPFRSMTPPTATAKASTPTSSRSTHPLATSLLRR